MLVMRVGRGMRFAQDSPLAGSAVNVSRLTSRHPPQACEICANWAAIQSAAASIPWPGGSPVSMLVSVLRVPKPTSAWIVFSMREESIAVSAFTIAGSAGAGSAGLPYRWKSGCAGQVTRIKIRHKSNTALRKIMVGSPHVKVVIVPGRVPLDLRPQRISNYEYHYQNHGVVQGGFGIPIRETGLTFERGGSHAHLPRMRKQSGHRSG